MNETYINEQTYLESIITPLLAHPEELKIDHIVDEKGVLLTITAHQIDMGRIIGKAGATANAIRTILRQYGGLHNMHISVKISDPVGSERAYKKLSNNEVY